MKVVILGSGTSQGVPIVGCKCAGCTSTDPRDNRLRVSVFIETDTIIDGKPLRILIDTSPDFRQQMLKYDVTDIDAVLYTHYHVDHIMGLDDIRQINQLHRKEVEVFANIETSERIRQTFSYIFDENTYKGGGIPRIKINEISEMKFSVSGLDVTPIIYHHGPTMVYGFRVGDFAYMTDCNYIPEKEFGKLGGLKVLVLDALRYKPHPTHFSIDEAVAAAKKIGAKQTYFTHITHDVVHAEANAKLPKGIELAYDGLEFEL
jgi:phosphoribosyl 1,2-cyclic phosphate phosphodiesterase